MTGQDIDHPSRRPYSGTSTEVPEWETLYSEGNSRITNDQVKGLNFLDILSL